MICPPAKPIQHLKHFDLGPDKQDVIPVMKQILAINPNKNIRFAMVATGMDENQ